MRSIIRSLEATGKRHIFLTGQRGVGKSTLFAALRQQLEIPCITTFAEKEKGVYLQDEGKTVQIGIYDEHLPGPENKMRPVEAGFAEGTKLVKKLAAMPGDWAGLDEIGYLESAAYQGAVLSLLEEKRILAVVRKQGTPFLHALVSRDDALVVDLDGTELGCVIMASGLGTRFGGNKLMAPLGGKPVIAWAIDAAKDVFAKTVVVTRHADVAKLCEEKGVTVVLHELPYRSDTVRLGIAQMEGLDGCVFLPGDQPFVMKQSLQAMALCAANAPDAIWQLGGASPMLFPQWTFEELKNLPQGKGGGVVAKKYPRCACVLPEESPWELRDIDTPQDLSCFCAGICCN